MKKINKRGKVHPATLPTMSDQYLALLPAKILTLAATLLPEDKEVLAYLISCCACATTKTTHKTSSVRAGDHAPVFECNCFRCYMSFWARWDKSPNRQLIHEIIEAYEEELFQEKRSFKKKKRGSSGKRVCDEFKNDDKDESGESAGSVEVACDGGDAAVGGDGDDIDKVESEKGSVRKIVSFLGERILGFLA